MSRRIVYRPEFDEDADRLGGITIIDKLIAPIIEALENDPFVFGLLDIETGVRYAATTAVGTFHPLVVTFTIDSVGDVIMESVDRRRR